ncbi:hypothetical protein CKAH01_03154 [Colletotrichum kahawae]|uniref:Uncharacterized protein n=1 Tax=Colletotrichum kahawae TaxID=34407 RepID=A0AAE0DD82_COLKA|nr:hypothetical protein CKAH01_03154 [Colletotrichum kahawae]
MAPREHARALKGGGTEHYPSARDRSPHRRHAHQAENHHDCKHREEEPRRRRIRSSRATSGPKASSQIATRITASENDGRYSPFYPQDTPMAYSNPPGSSLIVSPASYTPSTAQVSGDPPSDAQGDRTSETEIPVHLDDNNDGYYCCGCGIRRSDEHHEIRKFRVGEPVWRNFCHSCHEKHLASSDYKKLKQYGNFCFGCGFARSSHFNKQHPIKRGHRPAKNFCAHCMKRKFKKAITPTETVLGFSSDESDDNLEEDSDDTVRPQSPDRFVRQHVANGNDQSRFECGNSNGAGDSQKLSDESADISPSRSVQDRLRKRRSDRHAPVTRESTGGLHEGIIHRNIASGANSSYKSPTVEDASNVTTCQPDHRGALSDGQTSHTKQASAAIPRTPSPQTDPLPRVDDTKDSAIGVGSSYCSDQISPSKRATFNERVEVRTSPTYWQHEHSENDDSYANFRSEQYHEALGDGKKAIPLEAPLRDPDGFSARRDHIPHYSVDEESFNSWSVPTVGYDGFVGSNTFNCSPLAGNAGSAQPHPNSLYTAKNCQSTDRSTRGCGNFSRNQGPGSTFNDRTSDPSNRWTQRSGDTSSPHNRGKEDQPCSTNYSGCDDASTLYEHFGATDSSREHRDTSWSYNYDGASYTNHVYNARFSEPRRAWDFQSARSGNDQPASFNSSTEEPQRGLQDLPPTSGQSSESNQCNMSHQPLSSKGQHSRQHRLDPRNRQQDHQSHSANNNWDQHRQSYEGQVPSSSDRFSSGSGSYNTRQAPNNMHETPCDADSPSDSTATSHTQSSLYEPKLPPVGFAMEIPDDMSKSEVQTMFIPGYDDYVPWRSTSSV